MDSNADFGWESARATSYRPESSPWSVRWWLLLAILASVLVHVFLFLAFNVYKLDVAFLAPEERPPEDLFRVEQTTVPAELLDPRQADDPIVTPTEPMPVTQNLDDFELQQRLPDEEIKLTPEVEELSNFQASQTPSLPEGDLAAVLNDFTTEAGKSLDQAIAETAEQIIDSTPQLSEMQKTLEIPPMDEFDPGDPSEILDAAKSEADRLGAQDSKVQEGFSNLDDLLTFSGPLPDNTKPILMPTDLLFEYGKADLQESARLSLMKLGFLILKNPASVFMIEGHTDTHGSETYNQDLSERRAAAVKNWLTASARIEPERVETVGFGETRPLVNPNGTPEEQALNRRVEITIKPKS